MGSKENAQIADIQRVARHGCGYQLILGVESPVL